MTIDEMIRSAQQRAEREAAPFAERQAREQTLSEQEIAQLAQDQSFVYDQGENSTSETAGMRAVYEMVFRARVQ